VIKTLFKLLKELCDLSKAQAFDISYAYDIVTYCRMGRENMNGIPSFTILWNFITVYLLNTIQYIR